MHDIIFKIVFIHDTDNMPILDIKNCGKIIDNNSINVQNGMQANLGSLILLP